ncbi:hypothetical protein BU24DRAFT_68668 [Aaosphaeria arxii CBS 175.79]|uniref:Uncharacterized protein n=1 Tax=Aaosphaeria arxii CBS 175.79 TaxID=1450172 RepID=A0A6A5XAI7_9PLEO|nr:uncharacterized protein BU24DRAFT_68668 [Aaosphaeria arxii CBS 175.79]KAF2009972.1 hypothetical protein BU24DRAFT_68668 [Aaosphaeria arxii CBS 175.79]
MVAAVTTVAVVTVAVVTVAVTTARAAKPMAVAATTAKAGKAMAAAANKWLSSHLAVSSIPIPSYTSSASTNLPTSISPTFPSLLLQTSTNPSIPIDWTNRQRETTSTAYTLPRIGKYHGKRAMDYETWIRQQKIEEEIRKKEEGCCSCNVM